MLAAQLHGKLTREEENLEDLLTSNVFGTFKYLAPELGLIPFFQQARDLDGNPINSDLSQLSGVEYLFWHFLQEEDCYPAEPDLLIVLDHLDGRKTVILVEAKLYSDKSSVAGDSPKPYDQLAREYDNLERWANKRGITEKFLIYCTADVIPPWDAIRQSIEEFRSKRGQDCNIYWLTWRILPKLIGDSENLILQDLVRVLRRQSLFFYEGIPVPPDAIASSLPAWRFGLEMEEFKWHRPTDAPVYQFTPVIEKFEWWQPVDLKTKYKWRSEC